MTNATQTISAEDYAQFMEFKKHMADAQAQREQEAKEQEAVNAVKAGQLNIEDLVKCNEDFQKLSEKKVSLADESGFTFTNPKQTLIATVLSFAQCLAADQRTTIMLKTDDDVANDFLHIYASWAYRTTIHKKLNSTEACMTAKAMPYYNTLGAKYDAEYKEHFRTEQDEEKRGSQYIVAPISLTTFATQSKDFVGSFDVGISKNTTEKIDWENNSKELNRLRNDIDSDQFDLVYDLRDEIKSRIPMIIEKYNICENSDDFKKYAIIIAVATYLDLTSFNVVKDIVLEIAHKNENGNIEVFKSSLSTVVAQYKQSGETNISIHTLSNLFKDEEYGEIGIGRLTMMLKKIKLETDSVRCYNIPTQGLGIADIETKLAA